jgi:bacteriocin-like protein
MNNQKPNATPATVPAPSITLDDLHKRLENSEITDEDLSKITGGGNGAPGCPQQYNGK